jgi:hypothetical protein
MINLMILIVHRNHQHFFIYVWSKLRIFDFLGSEIYILFEMESSYKVAF